MATNIKHLFILLTIVILAFSVRWYQIASAPVGALIDEAHFGYLAQSLLETGKDEHGVSYPVIFKGFGDNKLPAGAYLLMPVVKLFGLSNTTIRIPSIIAGSLLVIGMYWLVRELGLDRKYGYLAGILVALSPWTFFLSRFGFESNLGLFFFTLGLAALLKACNFAEASKRWQLTSLIWLAIASVNFAATWYSYISYRPITIAILVVFWLAYGWQNRKSLRKIILPVVVSLLSLLVLVIPLVIGSAAEANSTRFNQVGILSDPSTTLLVNENRTFCTMQLPKAWCYLIWNKPTVLGPVLLARFAHTFSPQFLVTEGEAENIFLTIQGYGQFYLVLLPFILIGLGWIVVNQLPILSSLHKKLPLISFSHWSLLVAGLLFSPVPTLLVGPPQPVRISPLAPFLIIAIVMGIMVFEKVVTQIWVKRLVWVGVSLIFFFQAASFLTNYYVVHTAKNDYYYQSYLPGLYSFLAELDQETRVYIKPFYSDPLMFYAYYTKMPAEKYQQQAVLGELEASGFQHTVELGKIKTTSNSISYLSCLEFNQGNKAVFVTNEELPYPILYQGKSASGVHTYVFVYDATNSENTANCTSTL